MFSSMRSAAARPGTWPARRSSKVWNLASNIERNLGAASARRNLPRLNISVAQLSSTSRRLPAEAPAPDRRRARIGLSPQQTRQDDACRRARAGGERRASRCRGASRMLARTRSNGPRWLNGRAASPAAWMTSAPARLCLALSLAIRGSRVVDVGGEHPAWKRACAAAIANTPVPVPTSRQIFGRLDRRTRLYRGGCLLTCPLPLRERARMRVRVPMGEGCELRYPHPALSLSAFARPPGQRERDWRLPPLFPECSIAVSIAR